MGREVRMVPRGFEHPSTSTNWRDPNAPRVYTPKYYGWKNRVQEFEDRLATGRTVEDCLHYFGGPSPFDYMDSDWEERGLKPELYMMYEDTSEGTPISPAFETPEELARWLADNGASSFGEMTATYEEWLRVCKGRSAPSMVVTRSPQGTTIQSGVEAMAEK